jgi:GYF domain 2
MVEQDESYPGTQDDRRRVALANERLYVRIRGQVTGPFDLEQLRRFRVRGQLQPGHEISPDTVNWSPAGTVVGLFADPLGEQPGGPGAASARGVPPPPPPPLSAAKSPPADAEVDLEEVTLQPVRARLRWPHFSPPAWSLLAATAVMVLLAITALIAAGRYAALEARLEKEVGNRQRELEQRDIRAAQREIDVEERQRQLDRRDAQLTQLEQQFDQKQRALAGGEKKLAESQQELESKSRDLAREEAENQARRAQLDKQEKDLARRRQEQEEAGKKPAAVEKAAADSPEQKKETPAPVLDPGSKVEAQKMVRQIRRLVNEYRLSPAASKRLDVMELCREIKVRFPNTEYAQQAEAFRKQVLEIDRQ